MTAVGNWNHTINFNVGDLETPSSIEEVQKIVKKAYNDNKRVTVLGAIHSTTQCMVGSDIAISMTKSMVLPLPVYRQLADAVNSSDQDPRGRSGKSSL